MSLSDFISMSCIRRPIILTGIISSTVLGQASLLADMARGDSALLDLSKADISNLNTLSLYEVANIWSASLLAKRIVVALMNISCEGVSFFETCCYNRGVYVKCIDVAEIVYYCAQKDKCVD